MYWLFKNKNTFTIDNGKSEIGIYIFVLKLNMHENNI